MGPNPTTNDLSDMAFRHVEGSRCPKDRRIVDELPPCRRGPRSPTQRTWRKQRSLARVVGLTRFRWRPGPAAAWIAKSHKLPENLTAAGEVRQKGDKCVTSDVENPRLLFHV